VASCCDEAWRRARLEAWEREKKKVAVQQSFLLWNSLVELVEQEKLLALGK
jgi:hypothetical protein